MSHDVFISHSSKDKSIADRMVTALESADIQCWIAPRDVTPGLPYEQAILKGIQQCSVMVLVFSSHANQSQHVAREIKLAVGKEIPVIPFRIEDVTPTGSLEYFLDTTHRLDALTPPLENHLRPLVRSVYTLMTRQGHTEAAPPPNGGMKKVDRPKDPPTTEQVQVAPTSGGANTTQSFYAQGVDLPDLFQSLEVWFQAQNFEVQQLTQPGGERIMQVRKRGAWRNALGMASALNVLFRSQSSQLVVEIGAGKWMDKAVVGTVSMFILWPLALTAAWGAWEQSQLPKRTFEMIGRFIEMQRAKGLPSS
ncbi:MAG: toll/interleukin-1 receptor domain-containing protein [Planctomycetaceae bacterium]